MGSVSMVFGKLRGEHVRSRNDDLGSEARREEGR